MWLYILFLIFCFCYLLYRFYPYLKVVFKLQDFQGPKSSNILLGNFDLFCQPPEILYQNVRNLSKNYREACVRILHVAGLHISAPEDFEIFLSTTKHTKKSLMYTPLRRWLKDGLLLSSGEKWQHRRKILTPAFHFSILMDYIRVFNKKAGDLVNELSSKTGEEIDVVPDIQEFSLQVINETSLGHNEESENEKHKIYREAVSKIEKVFNELLPRPWLFNIFLYIFTSLYRQERALVKILRNYTRTIIKQKMDTYKHGAPSIENNNDDLYITKRKKRMAMLDILIEARSRNKINYEGICEEVDTFTFEGHDTVSSAISFCMLTIANHPEIQSQIFEEINTILGKDLKHPTFENLQNMNVLERTIKGTLRLYPSVHTISRIADEDTKLSSGKVFPKDGMLIFSIMSLHRNPEIFPDPEKFDPDRFLPENCANRHPFAYLPFSAGSRNCIGQRFAMLEMKAVLSAVIRNFQLLPVDTMDSIQLKSETILRSKNGIKVKFLPRKGS